MKKVIILVAIFVLMVSSACSEDDKMSTNSFANGEWFFTDNLNGEGYALAYIMGCIDALCYTNHTTMKTLYPDLIKVDIFDAARLYYQNNPTQRSKPIVQVILEGCK